ncbi:MAG: hypothetical protein JW913_06455 [Chitinispirillaceae bacterium]|nr:hypothetical protein [Chitinispirillaceae bacterium]
MKSFVFFAALMYSAAFALTDLAVAPDTAVIGDTIRVSGVYSQAGATAIVFTFLDRNGNGLYDESIDLLEYGPDDGAELVDGEWSTDTLVDGLVNGELYTFEEPWRIVGAHVNIITDAGGPDTGVIVVRMDTTSLYVSGTVQGPDGPLADVGVFLEYRDESGQPAYEVEVLTDAQGEYLVYLPEDMAGTGGTIEINALDRLGRAPRGFIPTGPSYIDPSELSSPVTGRDLVFIEAPYTILGIVVDENGDPVGGIDLMLTGDGGMDIFLRSDENGTFETPSKAGMLQIGSGAEEATEYLFESKEIQVGGASDTIEVTYRLHSTDMTISGLIVDTFDLGIDFDWVPVEVEVAGDPRWNGHAYAEHDGSFSLNVSSQFGPYIFCVGDDGDLPENYTFSIYCVDSIAAGTDTLKVYVLHKGAGSRRTALTNRAGSIRFTRTGQGLSFARLTSTEAGTARIRLFRTDGSIAATMFEGRIIAGVNTLALRGSAFASGMYIVGIDLVTPSGKSTFTEKVIVSR